MNVAKIMIPKISTVFVYEKDTVRQCLERFMFHGYTAVPVLNAEEEYVGCISEGDLLRHVMKEGTTELRAHENTRIGSIIRRDFCPPLHISSDEQEVVTAALNQNFVPIVDDRGVLCGIVTRRNIIENLCLTGRNDI